jgi:hypothetical protein
MNPNNNIYYLFERYTPLIYFTKMTIDIILLEKKVGKKTCNEFVLSLQWAEENYN